MLAFIPVATPVWSAGTDSTITLGISLIVGGRPESRRAAATARLIATGAAGTGTVTALQRTSTGNEASPNCRIRLNVSLPDRAVYQAVVTQAIPPTAMPRYQPGCAFPVRVDADDLAAVTIVAVAETGYLSDPEVLASGLAGAGTVTEVFEPAPIVDFGEPVWGLGLRVQAADGRPEYDVRFVTVHPAHICRPRRGERLAVRIAADDPRKVTVEWDAGKWSCNAALTVAAARNGDPDTEEAAMAEKISPIVPFLDYADLDASAGWLQQVFGFRQRSMERDQAGTPVMAVFQHGNGLIFVRQEAGAAAMTGGRMYVYVDDVEAHCAHVRSSGVEVTEPVDAPWGDRTYNTRDLQGHPWTFATPIPH